MQNSMETMEKRSQNHNGSKVNSEVNTVKTGPDTSFELHYMMII